MSNPSQGGPLESAPEQRKQVRGRPFTGRDDPRRACGRPKGLAAYIKSQTKDGKELADLWLEVMRDRDQATRDRIKAAEHLADRAWGRPAQVVASEDGSGPAQWLTALVAAIRAD